MAAASDSSISAALEA
jgi:hypothetical protein